MTTLTLKEIADEMKVHPRTAKRWWKRLRVPPDCRAPGCYRWTRARASKLINKWFAYWARHGVNPREMVRQFNGTARREAERRQLQLNFGSPGRAAAGRPSSSPVTRRHELNACDRNQTPA